MVRTHQIPLPTGQKGLRGKSRGKYVMVWCGMRWYGMVLVLCDAVRFMNGIV